MTPDKLLEKLKNTADTLYCSRISKIVLDDWRFPIWSGSSKPTTHHYGKHGLIRHVSEVVDLCLANNEVLGTWNTSVNKQLLFFAALFHDVGKLWDYEPLDKEYNEWQAAKHKNMIHHISRSGLIWQEASKDLLQKDRDEVLHAILSHHGRKEWGSPVLPATKLAWVLHLCDCMSARMDDCYY